MKKPVNISPSVAPLLNIVSLPERKFSAIDVRYSTVTAAAVTVYAWNRFNQLIIICTPGLGIKRTPVPRISRNWTARCRHQTYRSRFLRLPTGFRNLIHNWRDNWSAVQTGDVEDILDSEGRSLAYLDRRFSSDRWFSLLEVIVLDDMK